MKRYIVTECDGRVLGWICYSVHFFFLSAEIFGLKEGLFSQCSGTKTNFILHPLRLQCKT